MSNISSPMVLLHASLRCLLLAKVLTFLASQTQVEFVALALVEQQHPLNLFLSYIECQYFEGMYWTVVELGQQLEYQTLAAVHLVVVQPELFP